MKTETKLAMAAAFNGTMLTEQFMTQANLKTVLLLSMEDYFRLDAGGGQFNAENVLSELKAVPDDEGGYAELIDLLGQIGYRAVPSGEGVPLVWDIEGAVWEKFIDELTAEV
jgi:hypothetical protein